MTKGRKLFILGFFISMLCAVGGAISIDMIGVTVTGYFVMFTSICCAIGCVVGGCASGK